MCGLRRRLAPFLTDRGWIHLKEVVRRGLTRAVSRSGGCWLESRLELPAPIHPTPTQNSKVRRAGRRLSVTWKIREDDDGSDCGAVRDWHVFEHEVLAEKSMPAGRKTTRESMSTKMFCN